MRKIAIATTIIVIVIGVFAISSGKTSKKGFSLAGKVEVTDRLVKLAQADNISCAIIVKNEADVPIAIKRVVNPKFPLNFNIDKNDLLMDSYKGNIKLEVQINSHGDLGVLHRGDIFGEADKVYTSGQKNIVLLADKMIGSPTLAGKTRGNFFRTAAR
jgi:hypothetical protein